jgi:hypothetical protein
MFMHIVTQLSGRITALYTQVLEWLTVHLWHRAKHLHASFIRGFQSAVSLFSRLVKTLLSFKALLASLTIAVQSIKAALKRVVTISGQIGQQLVTTAHQTLQRVKALFKKGS